MRFPIGILPQLWLDDLRAVADPARESVKDWLRAETGFAVTSLNPSAFEIQVHHAPEFLSPLTFELNLWASSAFESMSSISPQAVRTHATAWPLIQLYYSAFFSAHCILRAFGQMCSQLDSSYTNALRRSAHSIGIVSPLEDGFYALRYDRSLTRIYGTKLKESHADTWKTFTNLLKQIEKNIPNISATKDTKDTATKCLKKLRDILENNGATNGGNWLSQFRNRLNYQKAFGVWYPYSKRNPDIEALYHSLQRWKDKSSVFNLEISRSQELLRFVEASIFITSFCREMIIELSNTRLSRRHFVDRGGLDFLRFARCDD